MRVELSKRFRFEAAHRLPYLPDGHKCRRLHGHSFEVYVYVVGEVEARVGWLIDYADIAAVVEPITRQIDHRFLNEIDGLDNPTSEHLARWLFERIAPGLPLLAAIAVEETCTARCVYRGDRAGVGASPADSL